jgi:hypothetical protein
MSKTKEFDFLHLFINKLLITLKVVVVMEESNIYYCIAKILDSRPDEWVSTKDLWESLKKTEFYLILNNHEREKCYCRFLSALHSGRGSLAFFESYANSEKQIFWKLRTSLQEISLFSLDNGKYSPNEKSNKRVEELQKEVRRLKAEIYQLERENKEWQNTIERVKQQSSPQVLQNFAIYEKYVSIIDSISSSFSSAEQAILDIGSKLQEEQI